MIGQHQHAVRLLGGRSSVNKNFSGGFLFEALRIKAPGRSRAPVGQTTIAAVREQSGQHQQQSKRKQHVDGHNRHQKEIHQPHATSKRRHFCNHDHVLRNENVISLAENSKKTWNDECFQQITVESKTLQTNTQLQKRNKITKQKNNFAFLATTTFDCFGEWGRGVCLFGLHSCVIAMWVALWRVRFPKTLLFFFFFFFFFFFVFVGVCGLPFFFLLFAFCFSLWTLQMRKRFACQKTFFFFFFFYLFVVKLEKMSDDGDFYNHPGQYSSMPPKKQQDGPKVWVIPSPHIPPPVVMSVSGQHFVRSPEPPSKSSKKVKKQSGSHKPATPVTVGGRKPPTWSQVQAALDSASKQELKQLLAKFPSETVSLQHENGMSALHFGLYRKIFFFFFFDFMEQLVLAACMSTFVCLLIMELVSMLKMKMVGLLFILRVKLVQVQLWLCC